VNSEILAIGGDLLTPSRVGHLPNSSASSLDSGSLSVDPSQAIKRNPFHKPPLDPDCYSNLG